MIWFRRSIPLLLVLLLSLSCARGYKQQKRPLTREEIGHVQTVSEFTTATEQFQQKAPTDLSPSLEEFSEAVNRFYNATQRYGPGSLEARNEFNRVRFHAVRLDSVITAETYPDLIESWKTLRKDYVDHIGSELGYRIEQ